MTATEPEPEPEYTDPMEQVREIARTFQNNVGLQFHSGRLAVQIRDHIRDTDPNLLAAWDRVMELDALKSILAHLRNVQRHRSSPFRAHQSAFDLMLEVDSSHEQRRFGDMVKHEAAYVVRQYRLRARTMTRRARLIEELMRRLPDDTTTLREVATEEEVTEIFDGAD